MIHMNCLKIAGPDNILCHLQQLMTIHNLSPLIPLHIFDNIHSIWNDQYRMFKIARFIHEAEIL